ncbi:DUF6524 family protein [Roseovarius aquimarinus]|uniref:DUF6524 family protein n=1 Tax=Roseovarius aquimarinus TaxID=1229156 RepID=A0ABW7I4Z8_9RHOB
MGFALRWLIAFALLALTFNPTPWNYVRWALANHTEQLPLVVLAGLILSVVYIVYLRATLRSIGAFGMAMVLAITAACLWVLHDYGLLTLRGSSHLIWLAILALSLMLGIGLSWSHLRRRLSGQSDMDDVSE